MSIEAEWKKFVALAKRIGAKRSFISEGVCNSVWLDGVHVSFDREERRAYWRFINPENVNIATRPRWLDNDLVTWFDTLRGKA